jgi:hypothetical protein
VAAIFLDLLFEGDSSPATGAGVEFLGRLRQLETLLPLLILTSERDEQPLQEALSREGRHHAFLQKGEEDLIGGMIRFLVEQGWVAQPAVGAFSAAMREQICRLRQYVFSRQRLESGLPAPILITGESGAGKSHLAHRAAEWLLAVRPALRPRLAVETFVASELERGQSATIELFGRGPMESSERAVLAGLAVLGKAQKADQGILIVEELGNSSHELQRLLLGFVETGKTQPLFQNGAMNRQALGPLDVLCVFTAQPRHLVGGDIIDDLIRRARRGNTIMNIPSLGERIEDIVPIFYDTLSSLRRADDANWVDPERLDDIILPEAQSWLEDTARSHRLSASSVADLVGQPRVAMIGIPYLEDQLRRRLPYAAEKDGGGAEIEDIARHVAEVRREQSGSPEDAFAVVRLLADEGRLSFPRDSAKLRGKLNEVEAAAANLLLSYVEACLEVVKGASPTINVTGTYKFQTDAQAVQTNQAKGQFGKLFELERVPDMVLRKLRGSDLLASLALAIGAGNRRRGVGDLLDSLAAEPEGKERLLRVLSLLRSEDERRKAEELLLRPGETEGSEDGKKATTE